MQFIPPFDQIGVTPPGPWTNAAPQAGIQGSIVNADVFPAVQDEILAIIAADPNLTPSTTDLGQAQKSISYQIAQAVGAISQPPATALWHTGADTSTSAAAITAPAVPAVATRIADLAYLIFPAHACVGATTINVGFGVEPLTRNNGSALQSGDYLAAQPLVVIDDGTNFRIIDLTPSQVIALIIANQQTIAAGAPSLSPPQNLWAQTVAGTYTFTVPTNVTFINYLVVGGGGGGHGGGTTGLTWSGGGGGAGGNTQGRMAVTPGQTITAVVGAGGAGCDNTPATTAGTGGTSSFGSTLVATGGYGGSGGPSASGGGGGGQGSGGQQNSYGAVGGEGCPFSANVQAGAGAASILGGGGRAALSGAPAAVNGVAPGSGGGGVYGQNAPIVTGGKGADGAVLISY